MSITDCANNEIREEENTHLVTPVVTSTFCGQIVPHLQEIQLPIAHKISCWLGLRQSNCLWSQETADPRPIRPWVYKIWHLNKEPLVSLFRQNSNTQSQELWGSNVPCAQRRRETVVQKEVGKEAKTPEAWWLPFHPLLILLHTSPGVPEMSRYLCWHNSDLCWLVSWLVSAVK